VFDWDATKAARNEATHQVSFREAATVFDATEYLERPGHGPEARLIRTGRSQVGLLLTVVYTRRTLHGTSTIRLISARAASRRERRAFAEAFQG
jgi:uncharacterized DUF497 family protein